jgi:hypothetical protein
MHYMTLNCMFADSPLWLMYYNAIYTVVDCMFPLQECTGVNDPNGSMNRLVAYKICHVWRSRQLGGGNHTPTHVCKCYEQSSKISSYSL